MAPRDPRGRVKAELLESQSPAAQGEAPRGSRLEAGSPTSRGLVRCLRTLPVGERCSMRAFKGMNGTPQPRSDVFWFRNSGSPNGREPHGDGAPVVVRGRESRPHGEGGQVDLDGRGARDASCKEPTS